MFYGELSETRDSIELPDCEYESLLELFRYMYSLAFYSNLLVSQRYLCFPKKAPIRNKNVIISNVPTGSD